MKIAVLGAAGFVGRTAARILSSRPQVGELLLVDYNIREAKRFARALSPKCRWAMADAGRAPELARLLEGVDAAANAVGPCAEYEKGILLTCAGSGVPAASIGDGTLSEADCREVHDAFRRNGAAAVSGCGMMPGWTELLAAHFPPGGRMEGPSARNPGTRRFLFCSLDRFGGYAFFRRAEKEAAREAGTPPGALPGSYFEMGEDLFGLPAGTPSGLYRTLGGGLGKLGPVGRELAAALLYWLRNSMKAPQGTPAAGAGIAGGGDGDTSASAVEDPRGDLAGALLAEAALKLAAGTGEKGLLPLPRLIGREAAERIAVESGARILGM
jgi:hypothetical protein